MEQLFERRTVTCLNRCLWRVDDREQTQEVKLSDDMPDIGTVLCARGQCILRSKEWAPDSVSASGGIMVWIVYTPENGGQLQTVEAWIPVQQKWELPQGSREGKLRVCMQLKGVDGRSISPRKLMVRATVSMTAEAMEPWETEAFTPGQLPEDVQLLRRTYPAVVPMEAGEKAFLIDEELALPAGSPAMDRLVCFELIPQLSEQKVIGGKAVFRGAAKLHLCYQGTDGELYAVDVDAPFSQYSDLEKDYDKEATLGVSMAVTSAEPEKLEGAVRLKCGLSAQYVVWNQTLLELVADAYSPERSVRTQTQELELPMLLDQSMETLRSRVSINAMAQRVVDVWAYTAQCKLRRAGDLSELEHSGTMGVLYVDEAGVLCGACAGWNEVTEQPGAEETVVHGEVMEVSRPTVLLSGDQLEIRLDTVAQTRTMSHRGIDMVKGLEYGEPVPKDASRPSLILRRAGEATLWELAKDCKSTVEAIQKANALTDEPVDDRILLIPVC